MRNQTSWFILLCIFLLQGCAGPGLVIANIDTNRVLVCADVPERPSDVEKCKPNSPGDKINVRITINADDEPVDWTVNGDSGIIWACPGQKVDWDINNNVSLDFTIDFGVATFPDKGATKKYRKSKRNWGVFDKEAKVKKTRKGKEEDKDECLKYTIKTDSGSLDPVFVIKR